MHRRRDWLFVGFLGLAAAIGGGPHAAANPPARAFAATGQLGTTPGRPAPSPAASRPETTDTRMAKLEHALGEREYWASESGERIQAPNRRLRIRR